MHLNIEFKRNVGTLDFRFAYKLLFRRVAPICINYTSFRLFNRHRMRCDQNLIFVNMRQHACVGTERGKRIKRGETL